MSHDKPVESFYHDVPEPLRSQAVQHLVKVSQGVKGATQYFAPWKHVPATYIICEEDKALPPDIQRAFASQAGGTWKIVSSPTGHSPFLVNPEQFGDILIGVAEGERHEERIG
jgi:pimeloyl-ACP methyl ester carboxylesterase